MANITITIDDAHISRVLDAFATKFNYNEEKLEGETKAQFAKRQLVNWVRQTTLLEEQRIEIKTTKENSTINSVTIN